MAPRASTPPPTTNGRGITLFDPTKEEIEKARKILQGCDEKQSRSKMQAMTNFLKRSENNKDEDQDALARMRTSKANERKDYLLRYLAFQVRKSAGAMEHRHDAIESDEARVTDRWFTEFQLRRDYGDKKFEYWKPHLQTRGDRVTGSTEAEHVEYELSDDVKTRASGNVYKSTLKAEGEATEQDLSNMESLVQTEAAKSEEPLVDIKKEPISEADAKQKALQIAVEDFLANPQVKLRKLQEASTESKMIMAKAVHVEFSGLLAESVKTCSGKLDKHCKIMEKMVAGCTPKGDLVPKLLVNIKLLLEEHTSLKRTASGSFGIKVGNNENKRRKKEPTIE